MSGIVRGADRRCISSIVIRFIEEPAVAYGGPGDRVRLSKPCGSSARDLPAGARHASIETITMGGLKMLRVPAEDRLPPPPADPATPPSRCSSVRGGAADQQWE